MPFTPLGAGYKDTCHNYFPVRGDDRDTNTYANGQATPQNTLSHTHTYPKPPTQTPTPKK